MTLRFTLFAPDKKPLHAALAVSKTQKFAHILPKKLIAKKVVDAGTLRSYECRV